MLLIVYKDKFSYKFYILNKKHLETLMDAVVNVHYDR